MFPFWEPVVAPLVKAAEARRVLEIGALRGETTAKMFDQLGPRSELHVIDPLPQFDPAEHEQEFPGRYVFHRALSLDVLDDLPPFDVALIDGDHNWYTVYHELKALAATSRKAGQPLPLLVLHDVAWPYGHRDLYYEPSQIPEEFRHPHAKQGMAPGFHHVLDDGGFNIDLDNAINGGGPRNGVMCALQDFLSEHDRPFREVVLPFYFGLAIVVEEERLAATPAIGKVLDQLESANGRLRMLKVSERIRIDEQVHTHNWNRILERRIDRHRDRYLKLLKDALLDRHYLDDEVRLHYAVSRDPGPADADIMRDPPRTLEVRYKRLVQAREAGRSTDEATNLSFFPYTDMGRAALDHLEEVVGAVLVGEVPGDVVEVGVGRGGGGILARAVLDAHMAPERTVWMVDRYAAGEPVPDPSGPTDLAGRLARFRADLHQVRDGFARFDLLDEERVRFVQGDPAAAAADAPIGDIAVLRIGIGAGTDLPAVLRALLPKVAVGGFVVVEGLYVAKVVRALDDARAELGSTEPLTRVGASTVAWQKAEPPVPEEPARRRLLRRRPAPRTVVPERRPVSTEPVDLSVVVVTYDMQREAARTLHSLSRAYQRDVDDVSFEVIVLDNGSPDGRGLLAADVEAHGPEFRLVDLAGEATPSPTTALNRGIEEARGDVVALMIDGAHVITPGVYRHALDAIEMYAPAVVATQQWYVGPGQQGDAQQKGYDQKAEDRLFDRIQWPVDGYRLFEIGHFIGDRDWFDGIVESNCLFVPRALLEQVGGFDDSFDTPGGGYANLELFERLHNHPGVTPASMLGEGSFHQFHGGTTTNVADEAVRRERIASYGQRFKEVRGRPLVGLKKPVQFVGGMDSKAARRTRSRRETHLAFRDDRDTVTSTETAPQPVPEEIKLAAIEALWDNQAWRETTWLGRPVHRYPTDLHSYQELLTQVRPEVVVLLADDPGLAGRALYVASLLDQLGGGEVVAVGAPQDEPWPDHAHVTRVEGDAVAPEVVAEVHRRVGDRKAVVFVGLGATPRVVAAVEAHLDLVDVGGYVVLENTVVNGRPAASAFGPGPHEAVSELLQRHPDLVPDVAFERYTMTFNKGGYLRRMPPS